MDVAEYLERPSVVPALHGDVGDAATGNGSGVVDENIDVGKGLMQPRTLARFREIGGVLDDLGVVLTANGGPGGAQRRLVACADEDPPPPRGKCVCHGTADALRPAGDQDLLALKTKIHGHASRARLSQAYSSTARVRRQPARLDRGASPGSQFPGNRNSL